MLVGAHYGILADSLSEVPSDRHGYSPNLMPTLTDPTREPGIHAHEHRHGTLVHNHPHSHPTGVHHDDPGAHDHLHGHDHTHDHDHDHAHSDDQGHGHSHGLVDRSILRSREGVRTVSVSLGILGLTAAIQAVIFFSSGSVALLADLIHNVGDALTAVPLGIAFLLRSYRGEKIAGLFVVLAIFVSACVAGYESVQRLLHPEQLSHLGVLALAGVVGFVGNELAAQVRLRGGRRLRSPALIADGKHARVDGYVSLSVIASAACVWLGLQRADPLIGLAISLVILKITWDSWRVIHATEPGEELSHTD
jgi:Co/Zn/Cd efflux system component